MVKEFTSIFVRVASAPERNSGYRKTLSLGLRTLLLSGAALLPAAETAYAQADPAPSTRQLASSVPSDAAPEAEPAADASPAADSARGGLAEITVTARRVEENLQRVPLAVTAVTPEMMKRSNIVDYFTLLSQTPGLQNFTRNTGNANITGFARIRGVNPVAIFFADAPYPGRQFTLFAPFFDVSSVQILKGPQGTLFGQASNAGVQQFTPTRPKFELGGYIRAEAGNFNYKSIEGAIDIPLVADTLAVRLAAITRYRRGFITDSFDGSSIEPSDFDVQRASIVWKPAPALEVYTMLQTEKVRDTGIGASGTIGDYNFNNNALNGTLARLNGFLTPSGQPDIALLNRVRAQILLQQKELGPYKKQGWSNGCPGTSLATATRSTVPGTYPGATVNGVFDINRVIPQPCHHGGGFFRSYAIVNQINLDLTDNISIKNIASHVWGRYRQGIYDNDSTKLIGNEGNPKENLGILNLPETWSEELQFHGKFGIVQLVAGAFGYQERVKPRDPNFNIFQTSLTEAGTRTSAKTSNRSLYGQANIDLAGVLEGLSATAGLRHDWDYAYRRVETLDANTLAVTRVTGGKGTPDGEGRWKAISYTLSAQYQIDPRTMVYINNSKGHSAGGLQSVPGFEKFDPDSLNNLELGIKSTMALGDFQLRSNLAAYYGWYSNVKARKNQVLAIPGSTATQFVTTTQNAASARIKGVEGEFTAAFRDLLDIRAFFAYNKAYYTKYEGLDPGGYTRNVVDLRDTPFLGTPKWKLGFSPTVHLVNDNRIGRISIGGDVSYRDKFWVNIAKAPQPTVAGNPDTGAICMLRRTVANGYPVAIADNKMAYKDCAPSLYNINANISWDDILGNEGLRATLYVTNITKNDRPAGINTQYDTLNAVGYQPNEPRYIYLSLQYTL